MTTNPAAERLAEPWEEPGDTPGDEEKAQFPYGQIPGLMAALVESRRAAIRKGIGNVALSSMEYAAIQTQVERIASVLDDEGVPEETVLGFCRSWADWLAGSPLMVRLEVALNLEYDLTDGSTVEGGVLWRALDDAIEKLVPYARRRGHWYRSHDLTQQKEALVGNPAGDHE